MYKVFVVTPMYPFSGCVLIGAENTEEANAFIKKHEKNNKGRCDEGAYYKLHDYDIVDGIFSNEKGFIYNDIYVDEHS